MHDPTPTSLANSYELVVCNLSAEEFEPLAHQLAEISIGASHKSLEQICEDFSEKDVQVLLIKIEEDDFSEILQNLVRLRQQSSSLAILVISTTLDSSQITVLINQLQVFAIMESPKDLLIMIQRASEDFGEKFRRQQVMRQIKSQNIQLESLNQNLEQLVHERTLKEYDANQQAIKSLKGIQTILTFIKNISKSETIEDLMNQVRNEFKKIHGLMPPVLVLTDPARDLRVFYFQGKQFTEKRGMSSAPANSFQSNDDSVLRQDLSNLFGRPYGAVTMTELSFQSDELSQTRAKIIFEHSLNSSTLSNFFDYSEERWSMLNMALENILLKEGLQFIAKQWSRTFNEMKDPIVIVDGQNKVTLSNSYYEDLRIQLKMSPEQGLEDLGIIPLVEQTFESGESQNSNLSLGGRVYQVHSYPIRLVESDLVTHVINQYVDVTQSIDLQTRVVQGEKMAAVGLLAGNIAHELNNPLTGIFSLSQLLLEDFDAKTNTYKDLNEIKDAAARCQVIIKDLLDFSSVGGDSKHQKVNVNGLVAKTLPLLKMAMRTLNSDIELHPSPIYVNGNPQLLQQVIFNLVNNACQAMAEGGRLTVIVQPYKNMARIIVRDTGPGIPSEIQDAIFDPFFTTKEEGKGTGLGLSMSRSVVKRHGGELSLNQGYKHGTEFVVEIPLVEA